MLIKENSTQQNRDFQEYTKTNTHTHSIKHLLIAVLYNICYKPCPFTPGVAVFLLISDNPSTISSYYLTSCNSSDANKFQDDFKVEYYIVIMCLTVNMYKSVLSFLLSYCQLWASQTVLVVKNTPGNAGHLRLRFNPRVWKIPWRKARQPTPIFLPGESPWTEEPSRLLFVVAQQQTSRQHDFMGRPCGQGVCRTDFQAVTHPEVNVTVDACASTQPGKASGNAPYWSCVGEFCGHEGLGCLSPILKSQAIRSYSLHCRNVDLELYYSLWSMDSCKSFNYLLMVGFKGLAHVCLIAKLCQTL